MEDNSLLLLPVTPLAEVVEVCAVDLQIPQQWSHAGMASGRGWPPKGVLKIPSGLVRGWLGLRRLACQLNRG